MNNNLDMNETILKVILVGDSGAGKTSFFIRYFDDKFSINHFVVILYMKSIFFQKDNISTDNRNRF